MFPTFIGRIDIQSWWEVPSIAHFSSLFSQSFNLPDLDIEDLEEALLTDGTEATEIDTSYRLLPELIVSLLKGCDEISVGWKFITTSNYQMFLRRLFRQKCQQYSIENPFNTDTDFQSLPLRTKLKILHCLCDFRLDSESVYNQLYNLESDSLRIEPLGFDENDSAYWYFYGTRLYREDYLSASEKKKRKKSDPNSPDTIWQVICFTEDDWNNLAAKFKNSKDLKERALYNILQENFLPKIPKLFKEKEAQRRRKLFQVRTSTRLKALADQKEIDKNESASNSIDEHELDELDNKQKISYNDRYQKEKLKTLQLKEEVRSKANLDRQLRAARRLLDNSHGQNSENHSEHRDEKAYRPTRRSRSSSLASIITTYASSSSTQISSDLIFQHNPNNNSNSNNNPSSANSSSLNKTFTNFSQNHQYYDCTKKLNKFKEKFVLEDKENINTITLSSDENDEFEDNLSGIEEEIISMRADKSSSKKSTSGAGGGAVPPSTGKEPQTATKLPGRQTNNSLSSLTGNIVIQPPSTITTATTITSSSSSSLKRDDSGPKLAEILTPIKTIPSSSKQPKEENSNSSPRKKKTKTSEVSIITTIPTLSFTEDDEVLQIGMHKVLEAVKNHNDAWPFMDPVEEDIAPRYYSIIRRPMDLLKMEEKLDNGEYTHFNQFRNDFKLIVNNCRLYNGQENEYTEMVNNLQIAFEKATKKYFEQNSSDEEGILEYPELKTNVFREKYSLNKSSILNSSSSSLIKEQPTTSTVNSTSNSSTTNNLLSSPVKKPKHKNDSKNMSTSSRDNYNKNESYNDNIDDGDFRVSTNSNRNVRNNQNNTNSNNNNNNNNTKKCKKIKTDSEVQTRNKSEKISKDKDKIYPKGVKRKHKEKEKKKKKRKISEHDSDIDDNHHHSDNENETKSLVTKKASKHEESPLQLKEHKALKKLKQNLIKHKSKHKNVLIGTLGSSIDKKLLKRELKKSRKGLLNRKIRSKKNNMDMLVEHSDNNSDQGSGLLDYDDEDPKCGGFSSDQSVIDYPIKSNSNNNNNNRRSSNNKTKTIKSNKIKDNKTSTLSSSSSKIKSKSASKLIVTSLNNDHTIDDDEDDLASISSHNLSHGPSPLPHSAYSSDNEMSSRLNEFNYDFETNEKISKTKQIPLKPPTPDIKDKFDLIKERRRNNNSNCSSINNNNQQDEKWNQTVKEAEKIQKSKSTLNNQNQKNKNLKLSETIEKLKMRNAKVAPNKETTKQTKLSQKTEKVKKVKDKAKESPVKNNDTSNKDEYDFTEDEPNTSSTHPSNNKKNIKVKENKVKEHKVKENKVKENRVKENKIKENKVKEKKVKEPKEKETSKPIAKDDKVDKLSKKNLMKKPNPPPPVNNKKNNTNVAVLDFETEQTLKDINKWLEHTPRFSEFSSASNSPSRYTLDEIETVPLNSKLDASEFKKSTPPYDTQTKSGQPPSGKSKDPSGLNKTATSPTKEVITTCDKKMQGLIDVKPITNTTSSAIVPPPLIPAGILPGNSSNTSSAHVKKELKDNKRKLKEKLTPQIPRKRELQRTIDRLQPGKTKGNLIGSMMNPKPTDELYSHSNLSKLKEIKNSLVVKTDDNGPKLSLGTVLNTENFGLVQQHNFSDDTENDKIIDEIEESTDKKECIDALTDVEIQNDNEEKKTEPKITIEPEATKTGDEVKDECDIKEDKEKTKEVKKEPVIEATPKEKPNATPNLSAWFKAFGAPKNNVQKKKDETDEASNLAGNSTPGNSTPTILTNSNTLEPPIIESIDSKKSSELISSLGSTIPATTESLIYSLPGQRQRKASTGSTISERSSFSQDPDSPRIGIDERLGQYPSTYPSPMGASPIMVSPKPDDIIPKTSPYPLNGAIKVGFYQDTTSKSSPDKSCSPRELPTPPYPNYSSHVYSSASPTGFNYGTSNYNQNLDNTAINPTRANYYEQYKQPHSQESDYNSSMSPTTNPTSPYQSQQSPFHQTPQQQQQQSSPYQQNPVAVVSGNTNSNNQTGQQQQGSNSPYQINTGPQQQQPPSSPFQPIQPQNTTKSMNPISPHSPFSHSNHSSPYSQHDPNSPYSNTNNNGGNSGTTGGDISPYQSTNNATTMSPKSGNQPTNSSKSNNISSQQLTDWSTNNQPNNYTSMNLNTLSTSENVVNNQNSNQMQQQQPPQAHQAHKQQQPPQNLHNPYLHNIDNSLYSQNLIDKQRNLLMSQQQNMFSSGNAGNQAGNSTEQGSCHMNEMINMGYNPPIKSKEQQNLHMTGTDISVKKHDSLKPDEQQQSFYEHLVGNISYGKTGQPSTSSMPGFAKSITDISTSKAFDMYNKAANYPKTLTSTSSTQEMMNMGGGSQVGYQTPQNTMNSISQKLNESQLKQQLTQNTSGGYNLPIAAQQQQQQHQQLQNKHNLRSQSVNNNNSPSGVLTDLVIPNPKPNQDLNVNQNQAKLSGNSNQQLGMDLGSFKSFNTPTGSPLVDPALRNLASLSMIDRYNNEERFLGLQGPTGGYYDNKISPSHMFPKPMQQPPTSSMQQMFGSSMTNSFSYNREQQNPFSSVPAPRLQQDCGAQQKNLNINQVGMNLESKPEKKPKKLGKKAQAAAAAAAAASAQSQTMANQNISQQQMQGQSNQQVVQQVQQSQQGFQSYAGLKNTPTTTEPTPISLKTSSVVPGSAFNFGPTPTGLGLYGENSTYLDDYRGASNPYYIGTPHRSTPETSDDKTAGNNSTAAAAAAAAAAASSPYHQFLSHSSRASYPFVNSQLEPSNTAIYQQYVNNMLNQSLLGAAAAGAPPGTYPQSAYHPLMQKHYDAMNSMNRPWFQ